MGHSLIPDSFQKSFTGPAHMFFPCTGAKRSVQTPDGRVFQNHLKMSQLFLLLWLKSADAAEQPNN
jgi:hypothetical protein